MAEENERKATGNAGANSKEVSQRQTSGKEIPPSPELRRQSEQPGAGANTPAGPFPNRDTKEAKRAREKDEEIESRDEERTDREGVRSRGRP